MTTKNTLIALAERYRELALTAKARWDRIILFDTAASYYRDAEQYNMVIWCRTQGEKA